MSTRLPGAKYRNVFDAGRVLKNRLFTAWILDGKDAGRQAGVVVSKKSFRHAVDRNRAKRLLREAFRLTIPQTDRSCDCVFVGRAALGGCAMADVASEMRRVLAAK